MENESMSNTEAIAASLWHGIFPKKCTDEQIAEYRQAHEQKDAPAEQAYLAGYKAGFYAAGNWFPQESWERYRKRIGA